MVKKNMNYNSNNNIATAEYIVAQCEQYGINLCCGFEDWTRVAMALANLGEAGRALFHRLARMGSDYKEKENDAKFTNALRTGKRITFATLIHLAKQNGIDVSNATGDRRASIPIHKPAQHPIVMRKPDYIDFDLITRSVGIKNNLCDFLAKYFTRAALVVAACRYYVGSTRNGATIFPQVDSKGRCRTGKVIQYNPTDGHRVRESGANWLHAIRMKQQGKASSDYELQQCLFGEHLLLKYPDVPVCLTESEKAAFIASMRFPGYVWVAVGGIQGFTKEKLLPLAGRKVIVYADADAAEDWQSKASEISFTKSWKFSDWYKNEQVGSKRDIADLLIELREANSGTLADISPEQGFQYLREVNPEFDKFCEVLDLRLDDYQPLWNER